jgi:hypothetical protein
MEEVESQPTNSVLIVAKISVVINILNGVDCKIVLLKITKLNA